MFVTSYLAHLLFPRHSNNHKARVLHPSVLAIISFALLTFELVTRFAVPVTSPTTLGYASQISPSEVIRLTNIKRSESGLSPVTFSQTLTDAAKEKGEHMLANDYWAHTAPDGTEPWFFFTKHGYKYRYAGENLARDFTNPQSAVEAWMASPSHRDNMLSAKYQEIGVAVVEGDLAGSDSTIVVQLFGTQLSAVSQSVPVAKANVEITPTKTVALVVNSPTPTLTPSPEPTDPTETIVAGGVPLPPSANLTATTTGFLSAFETTRGVSILVLSTLFIITLLDWIIILTKKVPRIGGRSFAHLAFLGMIIVVVLIVQSGKIM